MGDVCCWPLVASQQREAEENTDRLVTKLGTKSLVWDYLGLKKDPEGKPIDNRLVTK